MMTLSENCKTVDTCIQKGKGECHIKHLTDKAAMYDHARMFAHVTIPVGCSIGDHPHVDDADLYYIIEGTARVDDNGVLKEITAGELSYTQEGEHHSIENIGDGELKFLALVLR